MVYFGAVSLHQKSVSEALESSLVIVELQKSMILNSTSGSCTTQQQFAEIVKCTTDIKVLSSNQDSCLQLASVILKQYVETHWCSQSEKFRPPETTDQVSRPTFLWPQTFVLKKSICQPPRFRLKPPFGSCCRADCGRPSAKSAPALPTPSQPSLTGTGPRRGHSCLRC